MRYTVGHSQSPNRPRTGVIAAGSLLVLFLVGCETEPVEPPPPPPAEFAVAPSTAGYLMRMEGRLTFLPCGEGPDAIGVVDTPDGQAAAVVAELGGGDRPIPVLVRMRGDTVEVVRHAEPEGGGCDDLLPAGDLVARGNEPFWSVSIDGDSAVVRTPDLPAGAGYHARSWQSGAEGAWRFTASAGADTLRLWLDADRCRDGMSGAWFPYRATVEWRRERLTGCALEGERALVRP